MNNLKFIALAIVFSLSSLTFAATAIKSPTETLHSEIVKLIGDTCEKFSEENVEADVVFTVSEKGEIVIISVKSTNPIAEKFVKCKLNYKKINFDVAMVEEIYRMPLKIVNG